MTTIQNKRDNVFRVLSDKIIKLVSEKKCVLVGIDGYDGAGKSCFALSLANELSKTSVNLIQSSVDYFHNPRAVRYKPGKDSPEGYYHSSFNYNKLKELLLDPLKLNNGKPYFVKYFNHKKDKIEECKPNQFSKRSVLIFDGIFLHRPELINYWDFSIFLEVSREETLKRCFHRDKSGSADIDAAINRRYVEGQQIYFNNVSPQTKATVIVNNEDYNTPWIKENMHI